MCPRACAPQQEKPSQGEAWMQELESSPQSLKLEKVHMQQQRPSTAKTTWIKKQQKNFFKLVTCPDLHPDIERKWP